MTPPVPSSTNDSDPPFRWGLGITIFVVGLVVTGVGFVLFGRDDPSAYWEAAVVNLGTTILLAAALVWLERALVKSVRATTKQVATDAADQAASRAAAEATKQTVDALAPRLDAMDQRLRDRQQDVAGEMAERASRVGELGSFDAVHSALTDADSIAALARPRRGDDAWATSGVEVIVPAGDGTQAPRVVTTLLPEGAMRTPTITLSYEQHGRAHQRAMATWVEGQSPEEVFVALQEAMITEGLGQHARELSVQAFFANLADIVRDAILARRAADGAWLSGSPVIELVANGLAITTGGVDVRGHAGHFVQRADFGRYDPQVLSRIIGYRAPSEPPPGITKEVWDFAMGRATGHFVRSDVGW